jgi:hypothetical protein
MPYEVSFTKRVPVLDREDYINDCCVGGDAVRDRLLPAVQARYGDVDTNQEDWGWFIWLRCGDLRMSIDIFCHDSDAGNFAIHVGARRPRFLLPSRPVECPELDRLCDRVIAELRDWLRVEPRAQRLDPKQSA